MSKSVKATSAALRSAKEAARSAAAAQPVLVQSPAAVSAPQPVSPAAVSPAAVRTIADISQDIDKVSAALDTSRKAGFTDIVAQAERRLSALHAEKAALSPAPAAPRQSAVKVEDVTPPAAPSAFVVAELKTDAGKLLGILTAAGKQFNTGSRGYYANGKVEIGGKRYQVQVQLVEIGSKPAADSK